MNKTYDIRIFCRQNSIALDHLIGPVTKLINRWKIDEDTYKLFNLVLSKKDKHQPFKNVINNILEQVIADCERNKLSPNSGPLYAEFYSNHTLAQVALEYNKRGWLKFNF